MKHLSVLTVAAGAAVACAAGVKAPTAATVSSSENGPEAVMRAPVSGSLLQGASGTPTTIDDVLAVPSASAGKKDIAFEWADGNHTQVYALWNKVFAAAEYAPGSNTSGTGPLAETRATAGYMTSGWGLGASVAYRDSTYDDAAANKSCHHFAFSQLRLFGSAGYRGMDLYASAVWAKYPGTTIWQDADGNDQTVQRYDSLAFKLGARGSMPEGVDGWAWDLSLAPGMLYLRDAGSSGTHVWQLRLFSQASYVLHVDDITLFPGSSIYWNHENAITPDYLNTFGVSPYLALSMPLFEHWMLEGGARFNAYQTLNDNRRGDASNFQDEGIITGTAGSVGLRYHRARWSAEAQIANGFLSNGPYCISGTATSGLVASLGFVVNLN